MCQFVSHVVTSHYRLVLGHSYYHPLGELAMETNKFTKEELQFTLYVCTVVDLDHHFNFALAIIVYACCFLPSPP